MTDIDIDTLKSSAKRITKGRTTDMDEDKILSVGAELFKTVLDELSFPEAMYALATAIIMASRNADAVLDIEVVAEKTRKTIIHMNTVFFAAPND